MSVRQWQSREMNSAWLGVVHTIYEEEDQEENCSSDSSERSFEDSVSQINVQHDRWAIPQNNGDSTSASAFFAKQNSLQQIVTSWSDATGITPNVTVKIAGRSFLVHKFPLVSKSGYFKKELMNTNQICFNPPGGADLFEMIAGYCYGCTILMSPSSIVAIRCASEFYQMEEQYYRGNLCRKSRAYFQDVLKNWEDAMEALRSCEGLLHPVAMRLDIVGDLIESLAFLACSDFSKFRTRESFSSEQDEELMIINDLTTLPFDHFKEILQSIRRQTGSHEAFIGRALVIYSDRWVFDAFDLESESKMRRVVENITYLLPAEKEDIPAPISFLFNLLRCALAWDAGKECRFKLEIRISTQLEDANLSDLIAPFQRDGLLEIESMRRTVSLFMSQRRCVGDDSDHTTFSEGQSTSDSSCGSRHSCSVCSVARLWDEYLTTIANCPRLSSTKFMELIQIIPSSCRPVHDQLYKAVYLHVKNHPGTSEKDIRNMCRTLSCQRLSQEICLHAVQNDFMPLRMIVQAICVHKILRSNRYSSICPPSPNFCLPDSDFQTSLHGSIRRSSGSQKSKRKKEMMFRQTEILKSDLEEANSRLKDLENDLTRMRNKLKASFGARKEDLLASCTKNGENSSETSHFSHTSNRISQVLWQSLTKLELLAFTKLCPFRCNKRCVDILQINSEETREEEACL